MTSHVLTCGLLCREEGCWQAGHSRVACLVVAITQTWATMSLLWDKEVAKAWVAFAAALVHTHALFLICGMQSDAFCI